MYVTEAIISVQLDFLGVDYNSLQHYRPLPSSLYVLTTWLLEQVAVADCAALWRAVHTLIVRGAAHELQVIALLEADAADSLH